MKIHTVYEPEPGDRVDIEQRVSGKVVVALRDLEVVGPVAPGSTLYEARMPKSGAQVLFLASEIQAFVDRRSLTGNAGLARSAKTVYVPVREGGPDARTHEPTP